MQRLVVFASDVPFPPNRGGRADVWRRLLALKRLGHDLMLVCWHAPGSQPTAEQLQAITSAVSTLRCFPTRRGPAEALARLRWLLQMPSHVAARRLQPAQREELWAEMRRFGADAVWAEGAYPADEARRAAHALKLPWFYRSHNIEHLYMARQAGAAVGWRDRVAWRAACIGLQSFERRAMGDAAWVYDISLDDLNWWRARGVENISWLPPLAEAALCDETPGSHHPEVDVVFLGNLTTPNNLRGVQWLLTEIVPLLRRARPALTVRIAGSNPGVGVRTWCEDACAELLPNPADALAVYRSARVLVNPVRTGSGTHLKAVEMLFTDAPIVSTTQGVQGLPDEARRHFRVSDDAAGFAAAVLRALDEEIPDPLDRSAARRLFGLDGLQAALAAAGRNGGELSLQTARTSWS